MTQEEYLERVKKVFGIQVLSEDQATALVEIYDDVREESWQDGINAACDEMY